MLTPAASGPRARRDAEDGFTLVELLLTVALLGVVGSAIIGALLVMLSTQERTTDSLDASRDQQFLATYFSDDVASAKTVNAGSTTVCGTALTAIVIFDSKDVTPGTATPVDTRVAWTYDSASRTIFRAACTTGGSLDRRGIARNVPSAPAVSLSCSTSMPIVGTSSPAEVRLTVPSDAGVTSSLCGKRRAL